MKAFGILLMLYVGAYQATIAQDVMGVWQMNSPDNGQPLYAVKLYKNKSGTIFGRVIKALDPAHKDDVCEKCPEKFNGFGVKNQKIVGMLIMRDLKKEGQRYTGGRLYSPKRGMKIRCYIQLVESNKLKIRGFMGSRYLGRTMYWTRIE
ncbi:hypothetical protein BKI52_03715 [marine bacterium AO1-C]|nr:hypothetical protein BKI52_03715 [marine bacterium AO1-C]